MAADHRNLRTSKCQADEAAEEGRERQAKQQAAVAFDLDAEDEEVAGDGAGHDAHGQDGAQRGRRRDEQEDSGNQFDDAGADAAPRLEPPTPRTSREDVDRLFGRGELEEQRLQQDAGHDQLQQPARRRSGALVRLCHAAWMTPKPCGFHRASKQTAYGHHTPKHIRLQEDRERTKHWKRWGPYLSERAWGTVREDYSPGGTAWDYFPHDHARSRAYRWNEDGLAGICDRHQRICFAMALWNRRDPILKERLFGLTGSEGNHGEDVKEYYFYLDSTPTHSYMKYLYKYPQAAFPYGDLVDENRRRGKHAPEYELVDTGVFDESRYFDVVVEYAKADPEDILIRISVTNRGPEAAPHRCPADGLVPQHLVVARRTRRGRALACSGARHDRARGPRRPAPARDGCMLDARRRTRAALHRERNQQRARLRIRRAASPYTKDAFHRFVVNGERDAVNPRQRGTKAAAHYTLTLSAGETVTLRLRLTDASRSPRPFGPAFDDVFDTPHRRSRRVLRDDHSRRRCRPMPTNVARQAFAGLLWSKQYYHYVVKQWLDGDPAQPAPPAGRGSTAATASGRISTTPTSSRCRTSGNTRGTRRGIWRSTACRSRSSIPTSRRSSSRCSCASGTCTRTGSCPRTSGRSATSTRRCTPGRRGASTRSRRSAAARATSKFLERVFHKLLLNFTWWVNRKDAEGMNVFQGGFLGLDNIGVFDRSAPLPTGGHLEQSDGTSWMAMYSLNMLAIAHGAGDAQPGLRGRRQQVLGALPQHRARDERRHASTAAPATTSGTTRTDSSTTCCTCPTTPQAV